MKCKAKGETLPYRRLKTKRLVSICVAMPQVTACCCTTRLLTRDLHRDLAKICESTKPGASQNLRLVSGFLTELLLRIRSDRIVPDILVSENGGRCGVGFFWSFSMSAAFLRRKDDSHRIGAIHSFPTGAVTPSAGHA